MKNHVGIAQNGGHRARITDVADAKDQSVVALFLVDDVVSGDAAVLERESHRVLQRLAAGEDHYRLGKPISPSSSRRASTCPSEPVPPVMTTFLSSSNSFSESVRGRRRDELDDHLLPRWCDPSRLVAEGRGVEAAIDHHTVVRLDFEHSEPSASRSATSRSCLAIGSAAT